jgi:hypothetical protein
MSARHCKRTRWDVLSGRTLVGCPAVDNPLSVAILMIMLNRDNSANPLPGPREGRFRRFSAENKLVSEAKARWSVHWVRRPLQTSNADALRLARP